MNHLNLSDKTLIKHFDPWIDHICKDDHELRAIILSCLDKFFQRYQSICIKEPAPGIQAMLRIFSGCVILRDNGLVRSTELFNIRNLPKFIQDPKERMLNFDEISWDNKATLFSPYQPAQRTRSQLPLIDFDGTNSISFISDQTKRLEYSLNKDLINHAHRNKILAPIRLLSNQGRVRGIEPHRPIINDIKIAFEQTLRVVFKETTFNALEIFRSCLNKQNLEIIQKAGVNNIEAYNWLCGLDRRVIEQSLGIKRKQAVFAFPFAWNLITDYNNVVCQAVNDAKPLIPVLGKFLQIEDSTLRKMNGLGVHELGLRAAPDSVQIKQFAKALERMPKGQAPNNIKSWNAYWSSVDIANRVDFIGCLNKNNQPMGTDLLESAAGKWDKLDLNLLTQTAGELHDMIQDFHINLCEPLSQWYKIPMWNTQSSAQALIGNRSLESFSQANLWWHNNQVAIRARLSEQFPLSVRSKSKVEWPSLHKGGEWKSVTGLKIVALVGEEMLVEEHVRLGHCVNTYASNCLYNGSHILSVRTSDNTSIGTIEISQSTIIQIAKTISEPMDKPIHQLPPSVVQFKGPKNSVPIVKGWETLWEYVNSIMTGATEIDSIMLEKALEHRKKIRKLGDNISHASYNTGTTEALQEAWKLYQPILKKSTAKRGPGYMMGIKNKDLHVVLNQPNNQDDDQNNANEPYEFNPRM